MGGIYIEQPPSGTDPTLTEYLARVFIAISGALQQNQDLTPIFVHPTKFKVGKIYYYGAAIVADPIVDEEGIYVFKSTGLVKVI